MNHFSSEQSQELQEAFALFDKDKTGRLRPDDVLTVLRSMGAGVTESEVLKMCAEKNPDSTVSIEELAGMLHVALSNSNFDREIEKAFAALDVENSGFVPAQEIRTILTTVGEKLSNEEVDELFLYSDIENNTMVNLELFKRMVSFTI
ncbi:hypothetical protein RCL1_002961 [Eukaryota sp. TZLM3-RCL]